MSTAERDIIDFFSGRDICVGSTIFRLETYNYIFKTKDCDISCTVLEMINGIEDDDSCIFSIHTQEQYEYFMQYFNSMKLINSVEDNCSII